MFYGMKGDSNSNLGVGKATMQAEATAILASANRLDANFDAAIELLSGAHNKVIICGIGKSGHIGSKLAATFSSCGSPAVFLHAAEAIHGDLGLYQAGDPLLLLSKSGNTEELLRLLPFFKKQSSPIIAILGNIDSPLAEAADVVLDACVDREADPMNLMPTSSAAVALALGDALASSLAHTRGFTPAEFANFHPGGQLGRNLLLKVSEVMHPLERTATLSLNATIREVVIEMSHFPLGAACVLDSEGSLIGLLTDGDIRRLIAEEDVILDKEVSAYMTKAPVSVYPDQNLGEAVALMESRSSQISVLPVVDSETGRALGLIRLHDAYQPSFS